MPVPAHADIIRGAVETVRALHHYSEAKERHTNAQARLEAETKRLGERIAELQHRPQLAYAEQELAKYREHLVACLADAGRASGRHEGNGAGDPRQAGRAYAALIIGCSP